MLTTRSQKFLMFCIGFFALVLGAVMLVPFKSVCKADNMLLIEAISKLIVIPILIILLSIYPNKLKYIGKGSFIYCKSLTKINIPSTITILEEKTFNHCCSLPELFLPETIKSIGDYCFSSCFNLSKIKRCIT